MSLTQDLRRMVAADYDEFTIAGESYWSDAHLSEALDNHRAYVDAQEVEWHPQNVGGTVTYTVAALNVGDALDPSSGTMRDASGGTVGGWTLSRDGWVTFATNQAGATRTYTGWAYDLNAAAAEVCDSWAAALKGKIDVTTDDQSLKLSQKVTNLQALAKQFRSKSNVRVGRFRRDDAH